jgi:arabinose-5-phosphate isomerase
MTPTPEPFPPDHPVSHARRVLAEEADALRALADRLDGAFAESVARMVGCRGRVVVTGMGKSGHVGRKIAATLASTGTPALFLHPAEAVHGDLGMVAEGDVVLALSYSGETDELLAILPALRRRSEAIIAVTGNVRSTLARAAEVVLDVSVPREACPLNLAPTTSTTAMIALGDALAVAVMEARGFRKEDYALLHPAGSLGRRLLMRVGDVMRAGAEVAVVPESATLLETTFAITRAGAGAACVVDGQGRLTGLVTDGDTRRYVLKAGPAEAFNHPVKEAMTRAPRVAVPDQLAVEALDRFEHDAVKFSEMPVVDADGRPAGMLMLKDLIRTGIVLPDVNAD